MNPKTVILITGPSLPEPEVWGNLKKACEAKNWSYASLIKKKLPVTYRGCEVWRVRYR